ncbi:hypothetical protein FGB62_22g521 [Gracilaria domingensis]|nr:hypothetical protein FGB62_22g521 [Gracilaria domingensis]
MDVSNLLRGAMVMATGLGAGALIRAGAQAAVPFVMSATGTVVKGVGTLHAAGGWAATLQAFGMMPLATIGGPLAAVGAIVALLMR